jgi:hypothetical protein
MTDYSASPNELNLVYSMISRHTNTNTANVINLTLRRIQSTSAAMRGFVASVFYPFRRENESWSIVQWTEGEEVEALAIFEVDVRTNVCNWIIHRGIRESGWKEASIVWTVKDISRLKSLFHAAQHLSGILEWSTADTHKIYCDGNFANCSQEEYVPNI